MSIDVLLVEDNDTDADLTSHRLRRSGYRVNLYRVRDGTACMEYLRDPDNPFPDLILLDLNMPKKNGREVLGELRVDPALDRIPVVVMTSSDLVKDRDHAYGLGANAYIIKPGNVEDYEKAMQIADHFLFGINRYPSKWDKNPPPQDEEEPDDPTDPGTLI